MAKEIKNRTEIGNIGKIIIPEKLKRKIDVLHKEIGATEWSGILIYKTLVKSIKDLKDLVFRAEDIFLMNIGTAAYTSYKYDGAVVDMYEAIPKAMEMNIGIVHDHHNLGAFFSATDIDEIVDNAEHYNYYISLVVDFKGDYKCKIAIPTKVETKSEYQMRDRDGKTRNISVREEKNVVIIGDLSVTIECNVSVDQWFMDRISEIKRKTVEIKKTTPAKIETKIEKSTSMWDEKLDLFIMNAISFNNFSKEEFKTSKTTLYQVIKDISDLPEAEFQGYKDAVVESIANVHYEVYGESEIHNEVKHIKSLIETIARYTYLSAQTKTRIGEIIKELKGYITYANQFTDGN